MIKDDIAAPTEKNLAAKDDDIYTTADNRILEIDDGSFQAYPEYSTDVIRYFLIAKLL